MSVIDIITQLTQEDIRIWLDNGQLRFSAPASGLSDAHRHLLMQHKEALIDFLEVSQTTAHDVIHSVNPQQLQPLSFAQERIWFLNQLQPHSSALHLPNVLLLSGNLHIEHLQTAVTQLIKRHLLLHTAYIETAAGVFQKAIEPSITLLDIRYSNTALTEEAISHLAQEQMREPFLLNTGDVCKIRLWVMPAQQFALIITLHHIAGDAWSLGILAKELATVYEGLVKGQTIDLPTLQFNYMDYAVWQRKHYASKQQEKSLQFWQAALANSEDFTLPTALKPSKDIYTNGESHHFTINEHLTNKLNQLAKQESTTLFVVLLSMLGLLLHRYSQQQHFCIGTPISGRHVSSTESMLGCFINILPIPMEHISTQTVQSLIHRNHTMFAQTLEHQETPFEAIVRTIAKRRDLQTSPLFQIMFGLQNSPLDAFNSLNDLTIHSLSVKKSASTYDMNISAKEWHNHLYFEVDFKADVYSKNTINTLFNHFINLMNHAVDNVHLPLHNINFLSVDDIQKANPIIQYIHRSEKTLVQMFEQQCKKTPQQPALIYDDAITSFAQLNEQANQLAHYLMAQGITATSRVGIFQHRSAELIISLLAILKTGACYVPIDADFPQHRIAFIIQDAELSLILSHSDLTLPNQTSALLIDQPTKWHLYPLTNITTPYNSRLFNIIYTSGSTGNPKGVMTEHSAIVNRLEWMQETFPLHHTDCVLHKTPFIFDVSIWEIFWPLTTGALLAIAKPNDHKSPDDIKALIQQHNISVMHFVPSMLSIYLDSQNTYTNQLRYVFCSGETLNANTAQIFYKHYPQCQLINLYGPTEAAIDVSYYQCHSDDVLIPIGTAISNTHLYILDDYQQLMPIGAIGEIGIGGNSLAAGYVNNKTLTNRYFINNPFASGKLYLTGDYGYRDDQGFLHFSGRRDQQIKVRGLRVELGEIEAFLMQYPNMIHCKAVVKTLSNQQQTIVAYYQCNDNTDSQLLRVFLAEQIPGFMLPNLFIKVQEWPLLTNGKLNIQALPHPDSALSLHTSLAPPTTDIELKVAAIWMELLELNEIDIHDNFFELGGHSLMAIIALNRIQAEFSIRISLSSIFYEPTIANTALIIEQILASTPTAEEIII